VETRQGLKTSKLENISLFLFIILLQTNTPKTIIYWSDHKLNPIKHDQVNYIPTNRLGFTFTDQETGAGGTCPEQL